MKKNILLLGFMALGLAFTSCSNDPEDPTIPEGTSDSRVTIKDNNLNVTSENIEAWTKYASAVAALLAQDANNLREAWVTYYDSDPDDDKEGEPYAETFKHPADDKTYKSFNDCLSEIIDGCIDIAGEVGTSKIGEPRDLWEKGNYTEAVYAVESWYSFHSIDDYKNNILSIRNAFNGTTNGTEATNSIATYLKNHNPELYNKTKAAIVGAIESIKGIVAPFRSHIGHPTVVTAMNACTNLENVLDEVKSYFKNLNDDEALEKITQTYVNDVVLPTYENLVVTTGELKDAVQKLTNDPQTFADAALAWKNAREPWETSEAFLFGPVANLGLDPNMDSWPLDVARIKSVLESGEIDKEINWSGDYDEEDEKIEAAQNVRGFHTLEFLLFKDGAPRTIN